MARKQPPRSAGTTRRPARRAIDRDKLRRALRHLGDESIFGMLNEAIDLLPPAKLEKVISRYLDLEPLRPDASRKRKSLLAEVRAFDAVSRAGDYYESFNVNSKNFMDKSKGTTAFIADCNRLLDHCVTEASKKGDAAEVREAIEVILGLLRHIDKCHDDVIFFADEGGSWQVGVDWAKVLPAWLTCLSQTVDAEAYARRVVEVVEEFDSYYRGKRLAVARRIGTPTQRKALQELASAGDC